MSTTTTNDETPKKRRLPAKITKRIAELETSYALAVANNEKASAERLRAIITRVENGEPEELPEEANADGVVPEAEAGASTESPAADGPAETTATAEPPSEEPAAAAPTPAVTWNDVVNASAEVDANRIEWETIEEVIDIKLGEADLADIARANAADDDEKTERQRKVDDLKSDLKDEKAAIDALDVKMRDRNNAVRKGTQSRKGHWKVGSCFATNTATYHDPTTNRVVYERALRRDERQVALPLVSDDAAAKAAQLSLGETPDETDITDADALLKDAEKGEASPSETSLDNESDEGDEEDESYDDDEES